MDSIGLKLRFCDRSKPWAAWETGDQPRPLFIITRPFDELPASAGNGNMVAFAATNRETVDRAYRVALESGGKCEGPPALRPHYHQDYYGAYFRDSEGNKICVVCHSKI